MQKSARFADISTKVTLYRQTTVLWIWKCSNEMVIHEPHLFSVL